MAYRNTGLGFASIGGDGSILQFPTTGMPAAGPAPDISAEDFAKLQAQARAELATIGTPGDVFSFGAGAFPGGDLIGGASSSASTWIAKNKTGLMIGGAALVVFMIARSGGGRR